MLSLIKIRSKYALRHKCSFFFSYIFIPSLYFLFLFILIIYDNFDYKKHYNKIKKMEPYHFRSYPLKEFNNIFKTLKSDYYDINLLVDNEDDCNSLRNFILKESNKYFTCIYEEKDNKDISIVFKHKDNKYRFHLLLYSYPFNSIYKYLSTDQNAELFLDDDCINSYNNSNLGNFYSVYLELQILITKYLINLKNHSLPKEYIEIKTGINSYPSSRFYNNEAKDIVIELVMIFLPLLISFQFSLYTYFFIIRMIDEKEKKLNIFLERQGISKFIYYLSWFLSYLFINIIPILVLLLLVIIYIPTYNSHCFLFLINLVLLCTSLFSISFFFSFFLI